MTWDDVDQVTVWTWDGVPQAKQFPGLARVQPNNRGHVNDPALNEMLTAQRRELDPVKRKRIVDDIQRYLADKAYYVYIPTGLVYHVYQPYLKGFAPKIGHTMVHRVIAAWLDK